MVFARWSRKKSLTYFGLLCVFVVIAIIVIASTGLRLYGSTIQHRTGGLANVKTTPSILNIPEPVFDLTRYPFASHVTIEKIEKPIQYSDVFYDHENNIYVGDSRFARDNNTRSPEFLYSKHYQDDISLLPPVGSHEYNGYPIDFAHDDETLRYIGFKIGDRELIKNLQIEFAIDGRDGLGDAGGHPLAFIQRACACGPGLLVTHIGNSDLTFFAQSNEVAWFSLKKEIPFKQGSRMQIYFTPSGNAGETQIQLHSLILEKKNSDEYREVVFDTAPAHQYRIAFVDESIGIISLKPRNGAIDIEVANTGKDTIIFDQSTLDSMFENLVHAGFQELDVRSPEGITRSFIDRNRLSEELRARIIDPGKSYYIYNFGYVQKDTLLYADYTDAGTPNKEYLDTLEVTKPEKRIYDWGMQSKYGTFGKSHVISLFIINANGNILAETPSMERRQLSCVDGTTCYFADYLLPRTEAFWSELHVTPDHFLAAQGLDGPSSTLEHAVGKIMRAGITRDNPENYIKKTQGTVFDKRTSANGEKILVYRYANTIGYAKNIGTGTAIFEVDRTTLDDPKLSAFITWFVNLNPVATN